LKQELREGIRNKRLEIAQNPPHKVLVQNTEGELIPIDFLKKDYDR